jgi:hypothetical protein
MKKKTKTIKVKKVRIKKPKQDKPVRVKEYGKYKKLKPTTLKPSQMGTAYLFEVLKVDSNGDPSLTRRVKLYKGEVVKEVVYNILTNEIEHTVGSTNYWND